MVKVFPDLQFLSMETPSIIVLEYPSRNILFVYKQLAIFYILNSSSKVQFFFFFLPETETIQNLQKKKVLKISFWTLL